MARIFASLVILALFADSSMVVADDLGSSAVQNNDGKGNLRLSPARPRG